MFLFYTNMGKYGNIIMCAFGELLWRIYGGEYEL